MIIFLFLATSLAAKTDRSGTVPSVETFYKRACAAYEHERWNIAARNFHSVVQYYPDSPQASDSWFFLGISNFKRDALEDANDAFTNYLRHDPKPENVENCIIYKFLIAQSFQNGAKRKMLGAKFLPAIMDGSENAIEIFDEIITTFPSHDLSSESLFAKGLLYWKQQEYRESIDAFQTLIRRFPRHDRAPESFLMISRVYLDQAKREIQNHDILALAQLNLRKFEYEFPAEERLAEARGYVDSIKETFAQGLASTGQFYERVKKPNASILYYRNAMEQFPGTQAAAFAQERLSILEE